MQGRGGLAFRVRYVFRKAATRIYTTYARIYHWASGHFSVHCWGLNACLNLGFRCCHMDYRKCRCPGGYIGKPTRYDFLAKSLMKITLRPSEGFPPVANSGPLNCLNWKVFESGKFWKVFESKKF